MMKLKNLLFATMVACAFSSCSKDEGTMSVPTPGTNEGEPAVLSIQVASPIGVRSGALDKGKDDAVKNLMVYVFNGSGASAVLQTVGKAGTNGTAAENELTNITVSAGTKQIVVVANTEVSSKVGTTTIADFYSATKEFGDELTNDGANFSMNSKTYTVNIQPNVLNYMGYGDAATSGKTGNYLQIPTVYLYRNVAKICLNSVTLNAASAEQKYENAKFQITNIFVLHAAKTTKIVGGANAWSATDAQGTAWLNGAVDGTYVAWVKTMTEWIAAGKLLTPSVDRVAKKTYIVPTETLTYAYNEAFAKDDKAVLGSLLTEGKSVKNPGNDNDLLPLDYFYAYECLGKNAKTDVNTMLVVEGTFTYGDSKTNVVTAEKRYYPVSVGLDNFVATYPSMGEADARTDKGVVRNVQYNIDLTVKGPGYLTPFGPDGSEGGEGGNTILDVKVKVVPFGTVDQDVSVE